MPHILRTNVLGNPNIGLFGFANDRFCLLGKEVPDKLAKEIGEVLQVPVHRILIAGTSLIGVFVAGNNERILIPAIAFEDEQRALQKLGIPFSVIETRLTALGNNILSNDHGCLVNEEFEPETVKAIGEALSMQAKPAKVAELPTVGAAAAVNNQFGYLHPEAQGFEQEFIAETLNVTLAKGTVNMGNPYLRSGILVNAHGFVAGGASTGIELSMIDEAFGFLEGKA